MLKNTYQLISVLGVPIIEKDDDIADIIIESIDLQDNDIVVIAQKIISKAEGRIIDLKTVEPSPSALQLSEQSQKDPRLCELYIRESRRIFRVKANVVITEHKLGFNCTSAGIDKSNVGIPEEELVSLLPEDPDLSARKIRESIMKKTGKRVAVLINDSFGRPYREGSVGTTIGIAGISPLSISDKKDIFGREMKPQIAVADEIAATASLIMGQADEKIPIVIIRGFEFETKEDVSAKELIRPIEEEINR